MHSDDRTDVMSAPQRSRVWPTLFLALVQANSTGRGSDTAGATRSGSETEAIEMREDQAPVGPSSAAEGESPSVESFGSVEVRYVVPEGSEYCIPATGSANPRPTWSVLDASGREFMLSPLASVICGECRG